MLRRILAIGMAIWTLAPVVGSADVLYESATPGPPVPDAFGSLALIPGEQWVGVRFSLATPAQIDRIGAHLVANFPSPVNAAFLAIVPLQSDGFPIDGFGSQPDIESVALAHTTLLFPTGPSSDVFGDVDVALPPGDYAFVVGTSLFGSSGAGAIPGNNFDVVPAPTFFRWGSWDNLWLDFPNRDGMRFVLEGSFAIPPTVPAMGREGFLALFGLLLVLGSSAFRARSRRLAVPPSS